MNTSVAGIPLLTTRKYCPTRTSPSTLSLCHVFSHLYLARTEGYSIRVIAEALAHGRVGGAWFVALRFVNFCNLCDYAEYGVALIRIIRTLFFMNETGQTFSQVPLLMKNMTRKRQRLTCIFNIRYRCFCNRLTS